MQHDRMGRYIIYISIEYIVYINIVYIVYINIIYINIKICAVLSIINEHRKILCH